MHYLHRRALLILSYTSVLTFLVGNYEKSLSAPIKIIGAIISYYPVFLREYVSLELGTHKFSVSKML